LEPTKNIPLFVVNYYVLRSIKRCCIL